MHIQASTSSEKIDHSIIAPGKAARKIVNDDQPMADVANAWSRAIAEVMSARMPDLISDYIIDLVSEMRQYFLKSYSSRDLANIAKFAKSSTGEKLIADSELSLVLVKAREQLHAKMLAILQDPACFELLKKHMRSVDV